MPAASVKRYSICLLDSLVKNSGPRIQGISRRLPRQVSLIYYPLLKAHQFRAARQAVRLLGETVQKNSIKNILVIPVSPWILSAALALHKQYPKLNLVVFVMDDWQGHHECHHLPYSRWRRRLLLEVIDRATVRFAT